MVNFCPRSMILFFLKLFYFILNLTLYNYLLKSVIAVEAINPFCFCFALICKFLKLRLCVISLDEIRVDKRKNLRKSAKWRHSMQLQLCHSNLVTDLSQLQRSTLALFWMILRKILRWFLCKPCKLSFNRTVGGCAVCSTGYTTLSYNQKINWRM
jgi:hypothetical protein